MLSEIGPSCYHQISKEILKFTKHLPKLWDCINVVAGSASLTDSGNLSHFNFKSHNYSVLITEVNSSHIIVQTECTSMISWKSKWESSRRFFILFQSFLKHKDSFGKSENLPKIFFAEILVFDHDYEGKSSSSNGLLWSSFIFF